jgi:hypothetical protein
LHAARLTGFEAHRGTGGDVEPEAARGDAVEGQRGIGLGKVVMRTDLDRPVAGIGDAQPDRSTTGVELDLAGLDLHFSGNHGLPPQMIG